MSYLNRDYAKCNISDITMKCCGGSTSSLGYHLKFVHKLDSLSQEGVNSTKMEIINLEEQIARLASLGGISFNAIEK